MVTLEAGEKPAPELYPFRDPWLAAELAQRGYAVVPFLEVDELARVRAIRSRHGPPPDDPRTGFFSDAWTNDRAYRRAVSADLLDALGPALARLSCGHEVLSVGHLVKWPTADSAVMPHRDPSFVDERLHRSVTAWCPVTESSFEDGALEVVEGSHLDAISRRPHDDPANLMPGGWNGSDQFGTVIEVEPGGAVVFDHRLVHGSAANAGLNERTSIAALLTPSVAEPEYSFVTDESTVEVVSVGPAFFLEHQFQDLDIDRILATHPRAGPEPAVSSLATDAASSAPPADGTAVS